MTIEEKVRLTIGSLVGDNIALNAKVEELTQKIAELERPKDKSADLAHD